MIQKWIRNTNFCRFHNEICTIHSKARRRSLIQTPLEGTEMPAFLSSSKYSKLSHEINCYRRRIRVPYKNVAQCVILHPSHTLCKCLRHVVETVVLARVKKTEVPRINKNAVKFLHTPVDVWSSWPPRTQEVTGSNTTGRSRNSC